jgi:hypothetical protein
MRPLRLNATIKYGEEKNGTLTGMLSVNGYSGQVWYHTWHGAFMRLKDLPA